jgi:hypothetical protein
MIGDSTDDLKFAINNNFYYKKITNCETEIVNVLETIL